MTADATRHDPVAEDAARAAEARECPFCGDRNAPEVVTTQAASGSAFVWCSINYGGCGARGGIHLTPEAALLAWNRRAYERRRAEGGAPE